MFLEKFSFTTKETTELVIITDKVKEFVKKSGIKEGLCVVHSTHTTAGITVSTISDPLGEKDILDEFDRLVPTRATFKHTLDTPADAAGHIKIILSGNAAMFPVKDNELVIGHSQYILFFEFDGPRDREVLVQVLGEVS
ncbi:MAG TPA: secondary thiamine-phosphate synthase enzyme [Clostridiales bacterium]|nr:secondary thiamine-phosphate synthase enzyme [Clostridiales bacterium]